MIETLHAALIWTHILGIALFVGPQFFLAVAWVPASRGIEDLSTRIRAMRTITRRFGYLGGVGLLLIAIAGTGLLLSWRDYYLAGEGAGFFDYRFGVVFAVKMTVLAVMLALLGLHTFFVGPLLLQKLEAQARGETVSEAELRRVRLQSMALSITGLLLTLIIMGLGASLSTYRFSIQEF
jgi:uncharacterized membrane protein